MKKAWIGCAAALVVAGCGSDGSEGNDAESVSQEIEVKTLTFEEGTLTYEIINGMAVYQGDILLGTAEEVAELYEELEGETPDDYEPQSVSGPGKKSLVILESNACPVREFFTFGRAVNERWPSEVPYVVSNDYSPEDRALVAADMAAAVRHYADATGVTFVPRTDQDDYLVIEDFGPGDNPDGRACGRSALGREGGRQRVEFVPGGGLGCLLHELAHALGVAHEQSRSDRDDFVQVRKSNVLSGRGHNFDKELACAFDDVGTYDFTSVMHYGPASFMRDGLACSEEDRSGCTIVPRDDEVPLAGMGQRSGLSELDRIGLCDVYGNPTQVRFFTEDDGTELTSSSALTFTGGRTPRFEVDYEWRDVETSTPVSVTSDVDGPVATAYLRAGFTRPTLALANLSAGEHTLSFEFPEHCPTVVERVLRIEPHLELLSPPPGSSYSHGWPVPLSAAFAGLGQTGAITWESDIDGELETNSPSSFSTRLSFGTHQISVTAEFSDGTTLTRTTTVDIVNNAPQVALVTPEAADTFCAGESVQLRATVSDIDLEDIDDADVTWTFGGTPIATGVSTDYTFPSATTATLRVTAADGYEEEAFEQISLTIEPCTSTPPSIVALPAPMDVTILESEDAHHEFDAYDDEVGMSYAQVGLVVEATDVEDGILPNTSVTWTTDRSDLQDPDLGTGQSNVVRLYSDTCFGSLHEITATAEDSEGLTRSVTWIIRVSGNLC